MSVVAVAWLAIVIAPPGRSGLLLGAAVAAYSLPGAAGALAFGRWLRRLRVRQVLMANSWLRAVLLGCVPAAWATGTLHPIVYIALLAGSSILQAWGAAAKYTLLGLYWTLFGIGAVVGALGAGALRTLPLWPSTLGIVAGWGAALVPFGLHVPAPVSLVCFALGGVIYGPFTALSFTLFQNRTPAAWLTTVLAARSAALLTASPVGTALGGPLTAVFGPSHVLAGSGFATILLAATAAIMWVRTRHRPK